MLRHHHLAHLRRALNPHRRPRISHEASPSSRNGKYRDRHQPLKALKVSEYIMQDLKVCIVAMHHVTYIARSKFRPNVPQSQLLIQMMWVLRLLAVMKDFWQHKRSQFPLSLPFISSK